MVTIRCKLEEVQRLVLQCFVLACLLCASAPADAMMKDRRGARIGVFYFPGWFHSAWTSPQVWKPIQDYPDRKPLLGWYDPRSIAVMSRQLDWMRRYGIAWVAFDWTFSNGDEHLGETIDAYLADDQSAVKFTILWANHDETTTQDGMRRIVGLWLKRYMGSPKYLTVKGRPVVFIFSLSKLAVDAKASGSSLRAYLQEANAMARDAGLPGIHFVGGVDDSSDPALIATATSAGVDAISSYNLHRKPQSERSRDPGWSLPTHGYPALDKAYRAQWSAARSMPLPYVVPMTSGWDSRPWGGSGDLLHDRSIATPAQFRAHLIAAREAIAKLGSKNDGLGVICCWNEFGEGSFIEPTTARRFGILKEVGQVFGAH